MKLTLLLSLFIFSLSASALDCSGIWRNGFPDIRPMHTPVECEPFSPALSPSSTSERYFIASSLALNVLVKNQMEMIAEAVSYSVAKYSIYGRVPPLTIIRQDVSHPNAGGPAAMAFTYVEFFDLDLESCPIFVYPLSEVLNKEHLQQLMAHEVFHCVQKKNFKDEVAFAASAQEEHFWFEGLAQYFSNVVYPSNDFEYTPRFPAPDQTLPFFQQENAYSSENFWQSYANTVGERVLWDLMFSMPTAPENPATTVINLPRISEGLHNYAKEITLKRVRDSAGHMSPYDMLFEDHILADTAHQEVRLSHYDLTVGAFSVTIPKAGRWRIHFDHPENTKISFKKAEDAEYIPVSGPFEITSECDQERRIQIVITTASDHEAMNSTKLIVDKNPNPDCGCVANPDAPPQVDQCLIGTWVLDHGSVAQFWNRLNRMPEARFTGSTGGFQVRFDENNVGTWIASSWELSSIAQLRSGMRMNFVQTTNGSSTFHYSADGNTACSQQTSSNLTARQVVTINGTTSQTMNSLPMDPSHGNFTYSCEGNTFIFRVFTFDGMTQQIDYVFHKI